MNNLNFLKSHRSWENWAGIGLGLMIALAPWLAKETGVPGVVLNATLAGVAVMILAELDLVYIRRWTEAGQLICGLWVMISPAVFGYAGSGTLRLWHFGLGAIVALLGALEIWQFRTGRQQRTRHGG